VTKEHLATTDQKMDLKELLESLLSNKKLFHQQQYFVSFSYANLIHDSLNPFLPTVAFNICCPRDCVSRHNKGTTGLRGAPERCPHYAEKRSLSDSKCWNGGQKWVKHQARKKLQRSHVIEDQKVGLTPLF